MQPVFSTRHATIFNIRNSAEGIAVVVGYSIVYIVAVVANASGSSSESKLHVTILAFSCVLHATIF